MATNIKLKSSSVAGKTPTLSDLSLRELAVNTADGKLFLRKGDGSASDRIIDVTAHLQATSEPMGHEDKSQSTISFNASTRVFTIQPASTSFNVWVKGIKYNFTTAQTLTIPNTTGLYYIFFNASGVLSSRTTYFDWENEAPTAYVYWNATAGTAPFVADERHGITLDWATHEYLHRTRGAVIANGFSLGNFTTTGTGSTNADSQFDLGGGTFFDEDLEVDIVHSNTPTANTWQQDLQGPARIPVFYLSGTGWVRDNPTDYALKQGTARIQYNLLNTGTWSTVDVPTNTHYTTSWIIATNNINYPVLAIMGQSESNKISDQESISFSDLTLTNFPVVEFRPLWKIIWQTNATYANAPKARIAGVYDIRQLSSVGIGGVAVSDHGLLTGLTDDDHLQYLHTTTTRTGVTAEFNTTGKITTTNSIGIGTTNPTGKLDVQGGDIYLTTASDPRIFIQNSGVGGAGFDIRKSDGTWAWRFTGEADGFKIRDHLNSLDKFYIEDTSTGNVWFNNIGNFGIGTTTPVSKVHAVVGSSSRFVIETTSTEVNSPLNMWNNNSSAIAGSGMVFSATTNLNQSIDAVFIGGVSSQRIGTDFLNSRTAFRVLSNGVFTDTSSSGAFYLEGSSTGTKIIANGIVGIGTANPQPTSKLEVQTPEYGGIRIDALTEYPALWLTQNGTDKWSLTSNFNNDNGFVIRESGVDDRVNILPGGNVGIGTTNPATKLDVSGDLKTTGKITVDFGTALGGAYTGLEIKGNAAFSTNLSFGVAQNVSRSGRAGVFAGAYIDAEGNRPISFGTNGTERLSIEGNGNIVVHNSVGIGTTIPERKLHVFGSSLGLTSGDVDTVARFTSLTGNKSNLDILSRRTSNGSNWVTSETRIQYNVDEDGFKRSWISFFNTSSVTSENTIRFGESTDTEWMRISDGNVGIGITNPGQRFEVSGNIQSTGSIRAFSSFGSRFVYLRGDSSSDIGAIGSRTSSDTVNTDALIWTPSGNVGIGLTNPSAKLHVSGQAFVMTGGKSGSNTYLSLRSSDANSMELAFSNLTNTAWQLQSTENGIAYRSLVLNPAGGNVGIGTTNPLNTFDVVGIGQFTADGATLNLVGGTHSYIQWFPDGSAAGRKAWTGFGNADSNMFTITNQISDGSGHIYLDPGANAAVLIDTGSATGTASQSLQVSGGAYISGNVGIGRTNPSNKLEVVGNISLLSANIATVGTLSVSDTGAYSITSYYATGATMRFVLADSTGTNQERVRIDAAGNVGIGTTNPGSTLAVNGYITENPGDGIYYNVVTQRDIGFNPNQVPLNQYLGQLAFMDDYAPFALRRSGGGTNDLIINSDGFIGIGITNPQQELHIYRPVGNADIRVQGGGVATYIDIFHGNDNYGIWGTSTTGRMSFATGSTERLSILANGNVGIGTTNPTTKFDVIGNARIGGAAPRSVNGLTVGFTSNTAFATNTDVGDVNRTISLINESATTNAMSILGFRVNPGTPTTNAMLDMKFVQTGGTNTSALHYTFNHGGTTTFVDRFTILSSGNIGIGITNPSARIHIENSNTAFTSPGDTNTPSIYLLNGNSNSTTAHSTVAVRTNGANSGDPFISFDIGGVIGWSAGIDNSDNDIFKISNNWADLGTSNRLAIATNGQTNFTVTYGGSPANMDVHSLLTFSRTTPLDGVTYSGADARLFSFTITPENEVAFRAANATIVSTNYINFRTSNGNVQAVRITAAGNVGIGNTNATAKLHINSVHNESVTYLKVGGAGSVSRFYRYIAVPAKATAGGVADTAKPLYVGRFFNGTAKLLIYAGGNNAEEGFEVTLHRDWGTASIPILNTVLGALPGEITFHHQTIDNDSYYLFVNYTYAAQVPINTINDIRFDITTISNMGDFSIGTAPTIPTLNSSNQLLVGLFVNRQGRVAVGNNINPAFAFDGFGSLRMSSGTSFESQIISRNDSNDVNSGYFILEKSRNNLSVQNGDTLGTLLWRGVDSNNTIQNSFASISAKAEGTIGAGSIPAGLYINASSKIVFDVNGEKLRIDNNGNLGIGTTNPQYKLHVVQDGDTLALESQVNTGRATLRLLTNGNDWEVGARGSASSPANSFYIYDNATALYRFVINSTGNVGIGTTNANRQLHIAAAGESNIVLENMGAGTDQKKSRIYHDTSNDFRISFINDAFSTENYILWAKRGSGFTTAQTLLNPSGGNVGIGTTNALVKLDIGGETSQFPYSLRIQNTSHATSKRASIAFGNGASHQILIDANGNGNEDFSIYQANINRSPFFIHHQTGHVGIGGLTTPPSPLAVNGYITENPGDGTFYNVVTQRDVGFNPNQIPLNQYLGQLAFMDDYSPTQIYNPSTTTAQLTIAQSQTSGYGFIQLGRSATATNNFHFGSEGNGSFNFWNGNWGAGVGPRFTITSDGRIGIGSAGPVATLDVRTNAPQWSAFNYGANIIVGGSRNNAIGILDSTNSNPWAMVNGGGNLIFARMPALGDTASAPNILHTFANTGNVGINTNSPGQRFTNYTNADGAIHTFTQNASTGVSAYSAFHLNTGDANAYFFLNSQNRSADGGTRTATVRNDSGDLRLQAMSATGIIIKATTGNVGIDTASPTFKLQVNGSFAATTKSFVIDHPTKPGFKLRYGSLEGPENGVYIRGRLSESNTIELPEYWTELVAEDSITVNLTPIGRNPGIHSVIDISNNSIVIESSNDVINCFFTVFAERKDVDKLITEYES
jgi:hypothetical protein